MSLDYKVEEKRRESWGRKACKGVAYMLTAALLAYGGMAEAKTKEKKGKQIRQVVIKEVTRVEGKIQKPEVWYLLPRGNLSFDTLKFEKKLIPKIEEVIEDDVFKVKKEPRFY